MEQVIESVELISALLNGQDLECNHAEPGSYYHEKREMVSGVRSYVSEQSGERYFEVWGWGTAFGNPQDRVIDLLKHPEKWQINKVK